MFVPQFVALIEFSVGISVKLVSMFTNVYSGKVLCFIANRAYIIKCGQWLVVVD